MRNILLLLAAVGMILTACERANGIDAENSTPKIELSEQKISAGADSATLSVRVTSPCSWNATSESDWIRINTKTGIAGTESLKFTIAHNNNVEERKGTIVISNSNYNLIAELYIEQKAFSPICKVSTSEIKFPFLGGEEVVDITANFEYNYSTSASWISIRKTANGITIYATESGLGIHKSRTTSLKIYNEKYNFAKNIYIEQSGLSEEEAKRTITYSSSDGNMVSYDPGAFDSSVLYHKYGMILFNKPITRIGKSAFEECKTLSQITIPQGITEIGERAFMGCWELDEINIPSSVTIIGNHAFHACNKLQTITIPDSVNRIGEGAFYACNNLTSINIPKGITTIEQETFSGCGLLDIIIPDSVTSIGDSAFQNCKIYGITIPNSIVSIGPDAFLWCRNLTRVYIRDLSAWCKICFGGIDYSSNPLRNTNAILYLNNTAVTEIVVSSNISEIRNGAFYGCRNLTSLIIPDDVVTSIGDHAFCNCTSLTSVTIGDGVKSIGDNAFCNCTSLPSVTIGDGVKSIGGRAFYGCSDLRSVTIGKEVSTIGNNAFNTNRASEININRTLEIKINSKHLVERDYTLDNYSNKNWFDTELPTRLILGDNIAKIGDYAFKDCVLLTSVTIPDSVTEIGKYPFDNCESLNSFYGKFASSDNRCLIIDGRLTYVASSGLARYTIPNEVTSIGCYAFEDMDSLISITISDSVTSIESYAFRSCSSLRSIAIGNSVNSIGQFAFSFCKSLTTITIPRSVTSIGEYAFSDCSSLKTVYCKPTTPPKIDYYIFTRNASERKIYVPTASVEAYKTASIWSGYADNIVGYDFE